MYIFIPAAFLLSQTAAETTVSDHSIALIAGLAAAIGAIVSSIISALINGIFNLRIKRQELERQDAELAATLTTIKHQQLVAIQDWSIRSAGITQKVDLWDPLVAGIEYLRGLAEYRRTGRWIKGESAPDQEFAVDVGQAPKV